MELPQNLIFFALIFVVMYFFMIRPQQKKVKQEKEFESALKAGDRVITKSGFHGKISEINEQTMIIETLAGKLKIERSAISMELSKKLQEPSK